MRFSHWLALAAALVLALPAWAQSPADSGSETAGGSRNVHVSMGVGVSGVRGESATSVTGSHYAAGESVFVAKPVQGDAVAAGGTVELSSSIGENAIAAGGNLQLNGRVAQNAIVAGGNVTVSRPVGQDVIAAGGNVSIEGAVGDDVRAAGGTVSVSGPVTGDVAAVGGNLTLDSGATVGGDAWLGGGTINVRGTVTHDLHARGGDVRLDGTVRGNAELRGAAIVVGPTARVQGRLVYASPQAARIDPAAVITGGVKRLPTPLGLRPEGVHWVGLVLGWIVALLALLTTTTVLRWVFPRASVQTAATLARHPWKSLGLGFALLLCIPAAAVVLFITVIGTPLGLILLLLYPLALALGWFVFAVWIAEGLGRLWFGRQGPALAWQVLLLWLGVLVMALVCLIPWLGQLLLFVALLFGLGALGLHLAGRYASGGAAQRP